MKRRPLLGFVFLISVGAGVAACSGDGAKTGGVGETDGGGEPTNENDDRADHGDAAPPASWPDSGLGPPAKAITCPSGPCEGAGGLAACCADDGSCGAQYLGAAGAGCVPIDGEGLLDPTCPSSGETFGCCRPNGFCGAFYTSTFGCVDPQVFPNPPEQEVPCTRTP